MKFSKAEKIFFSTSYKSVITIWICNIYISNLSSGYMTIIEPKHISELVLNIGVI